MAFDQALVDVRRVCKGTLLPCLPCFWDKSVRVSCEVVQVLVWKSCFVEDRAKAGFLLIATGLDPEIGAVYPVLFVTVATLLLGAGIGSAIKIRI